MPVIMPESAWDAYTGVRKRGEKPHPLAGQFVDMGRDGVGVAIAAEVGADILQANPRIFGLFGGLRLGGDGGEGGQSQEREVQPSSEIGEKKSSARRERGEISPK